MSSQLRSPLAAVIVAALGAGSVVADEKPLKPGEVREFEIAAGAKMKFCWIPPGKAQLGAPKSERQAVQILLKEDIEPAWLASEAEESRGKYTSKGYWLGKYPVTQAEWQAMMGNNPSWFSKDGNGKENVVGLDTSRFPVEQVSWKDCGKFLDKLNDRGGVEKAFGKQGKFVLPHEDEWEYACRGSRGNAMAYYFGNLLNGKQANCNGSRPFGTDVNGPFIKRTSEVGAYERESPHPWGLCDMHGNVLQWCENWSDRNQTRHRARGGSWAVVAWACRSANRYPEVLEWRSEFLGFRVCFRHD